MHNLSAPQNTWTQPEGTSGHIREVGEALHPQVQSLQQVKSMDSEPAGGEDPLIQ